jgi:hypothetical protein
MHALNSHIANAGDTVYAMIPTYWNPSHFIPCKFYIEYAWHSIEHVYYHGIITELLTDDFNCLKILSTAHVKAIDRKTNQLKMIQLAMPTLFDKERMLSHIQIVQKDWKLDVPGPFVAKGKADFMKLHSEIKKYFKTLSDSLSYDIG